MKIIQTDGNNDWNFFSTIDGINALMQNIKQRLLCFANDWFLDMDIGIDWYRLLGNKNTESIIGKEIRRVILETEGVSTIIFLNVIKIDTSKLNIESSVVTTSNVLINMATEINLNANK